MEMAESNHTILLRTIAIREVSLAPLLENEDAQPKAKKFILEDKSAIVKVIEERALCKSSLKHIYIVPIRS